MTNLVDGPMAVPEAGGQNYANSIFQTQQRQLAPQYAMAVRQARQNSANRGLESSGIGQLPEGQLQQGYQNNLFDASQGAALQGANVNLENQRQQMARDFAQQQQERQFAAQKAMQQAMFEQENNAAMMQAIGGAGAAVGKGVTAGMF